MDNSLLVYLLDDFDVLNALSHIVLEVFLSLFWCSALLTVCHPILKLVFNLFLLDQPLNLQVTLILHPWSILFVSVGTQLAIFSDSLSVRLRYDALMFVFSAQLCVVHAIVKVCLGQTLLGLPPLPHQRWLLKHLCRHLGLARWQLCGALGHTFNIRKCYLFNWRFDQSTDWVFVDHSFILRSYMLANLVYKDAKERDSFEQGDELLVHSSSSSNTVCRWICFILFNLLESLLYLDDLHKERHVFQKFINGLVGLMIVYNLHDFTLQKLD